MLKLLGCGFQLFSLLELVRIQHRHLASQRAPPGLPVERGLEDGAQLEVVRLRNGIVFVIVALGAVNRQSEKRRGDNLQRVRDRLIRFGGDVRALAGRAVRCHAQEAGCDQLLHPILISRIHLVKGRRRQLIPRQLLTDELVPRQILVERADHVVAILPSRLPSWVLAGRALRVGVAGDVQPVSPPALPVMRRLEESIKDLFVRGRRGIRQEVLHFLGAGRQAYEIEISAANEHASICFRSERETLGLQPGEHEGIDGCPHALLVFHRWGNWGLNRLKRPKLLLFAGNEKSRSELLGFCPGGPGTLLDPAANDSDILGEKLLLSGGHRLADDLVEEQTLLGSPGDHGRPRLPP